MSLSNTVRKYICIQSQLHCGYLEMPKGKVTDDHSNSLGGGIAYNTALIYIYPFDILYCMSVSIQSRYSHM